MAKSALSSVLLVLLSTTAGAQSTPPDAGFAGETRVTAIDLVVEVSGRRSAARRSSPEDFQVLADGSSVPVVAVAPVTAPWSLVIYVDGPLSSPATVYAAASALALRSEQLTSLGSVELLVADPEPKVRLPQTRDPELVEQALSRLALDPYARDALRALRKEALEADPADAGLADRSALMAAALSEEQRLVESSLDHLTTWLAGRQGTAGPRALLYIQDGFELSPAAFYGAEASRGDAVQLAEGVARSAAAYGWTVLPLSFRGVDPNAPQGPSDFDRFRYQSADGPAGDSTSLITAKIPLKRRRTAREKAAAPPPLLANPSAPLERIALASGGERIGDVKELTPALEGLARRQVVTVQVPWDLDGRLRPLEVRSGEATVHAPRWVRSGSPEALAEARLRRLAAADPLPQLLPLVTGSATADGVAALTVRPRAGMAPELAAGPVRITVAVGDDVPRRFEHHLRPGPIRDDWEVTLPIPDGANGWVAVLVDNLADGVWGSIVHELPN